MAQPNDKPTVNFTSEDIQKIIASTIATAIAAAKEPNELEKIQLEEKKAEIEARKAQIEQDQKTRRETAQQQIQIMENKRQEQKLCSHKARDGHSHCVFINDELNGYCLCQKCQAVVRPGPEPAKSKGNVIYNTELFNRLFQECNSGNGLWS